MGVVTVTPTDYMGRPVGPSRTVALDDGTLDASGPPVGASITEIMEWVGYDPERAKAVLTHEHGRSQPRSTLIAQLEAILKESR